MNQIYGALSKYGKPAATAGSAGVIGLALVDQALQGDSQAIEIIQNNSEVIDQTGHRAVGFLGAIASEYGYSKIKDGESDEGFGKYAVMLTGAYAAGGIGQASQYVISGTPELLAATQSATGGLLATAGQIGADSHNFHRYDDKDYENEKPEK